MPTFTNAGRCVAFTVRPTAGYECLPGAVASTSGTATTITYPALTLNVTNGTSVVVRGTVNTRPDVVIPTPTGHTLIDANGNQPGYGTYRLNTTTSAPAATSAVSRGSANTSFSVEVKDVNMPVLAATDGRDTMSAAPTATPPVSATQAAYRFFAPGAEASSAALMGQDNPAIGNLDNGDGLGTLRVRMQSTAASTFQATDDWQLQWEKNGNGSWRDVAIPPTLLHMYDETNYSGSSLAFGISSLQEIGQGFLGRGGKITKAGFYIAKNGSPAAGNVTCALYRMGNGVLGTTGVPDNPPVVVATSTTSIPVTSLSSAGFTWVDFDFDGTFTMVSDVPYFIVLRCPTVGNASNAPSMAIDQSSPTHAGNVATRQQNGNWSPAGTMDAIFRIYGDDVVIPYDDPALTDGQATTNRLTGGTGTFVPGKVSEDGLVDNQGISADNFTELSYSLQIKAASFTQGDVLRFRVLYNGAPDVLTFAVVPQLNVTKTIAPQTVTLAVTDGTDTMSAVLPVDTAQLYLSTNFTQRTAGVHRAINSAKLNGTAVGWVPLAMGTQRVSVSNVQSAQVTPVNGPTNGIEVVASGNPMEWFSPPVDKNFTLSGNIECQLWDSSIPGTNCAGNFILERLDSQMNVVSTIVKSTNTVATTNTPTKRNIVVTPTSTNMVKGDRFRLRLFLDDAPTMVATAVMQLDIGTIGGVPDAVGDTWIKFDDKFNFQEQRPSGTVLYLTDTAGPAVGAQLEKEMWTARGSGPAAGTITTVTGWQAGNGIQFASAGTAIEWYTKPLTSFSLDGIVEVNLRPSATDTNDAGIRVEIAVVNNDGSSPVIWCNAPIVASATPGGPPTTNVSGGVLLAETEWKSWLSGPTTAVADNQRLRLRVFGTNMGTTQMFVGATVSFNYGGTTASAAGDAWIQLPQTITEFGASQDSTGTLVVTDGVDTLASAATTTAPTHSSTLAVTDGTDTIANTATTGPPTFSSTLVLSDGLDTISAAGQPTPPTHTAALVITDGADTIVGTATATPPTHTATLVKTDGIDTMVATATAAAAPTFTATLVITDGPDTIVAAGRFGPTGTFAVTDGPDTIITAATATPPTHSATLAITDGIDTIVASAQALAPGFNAALTVTDGADTIVASAQATPPTHTGSVVQTDGRDTVVATATAGVLATLTATDGADQWFSTSTTTSPTQSSTLSVTDGLDTLAAAVSTTAPTHTATLVRTDGADTIALSALTATGSTGSLTLSDGVDTVAASGVATPPGLGSFLSVFDGADTLAATATATPPTQTATLTATDGADTFSATETATPPTHSATFSVSDNVDVLTAVVSTIAPIQTGILLTTDGQDSIVATGSHAAPGNTAGAITVSDNPDTLVATATATIPTHTATLVITDGQDTFGGTTAATPPTHDSAVNVSDGRDTIVAVGAHSIPGSSATLVLADGTDTLTSAPATVAPVSNATVVQTDGKDTMVAVAVHTPPGNSSTFFSLADGIDSLVTAVLATPPTHSSTFALVEGRDTMLSSASGAPPLHLSSLLLADRVDTLAAAVNTIAPVMTSSFALADSRDTLAAVINAYDDNFQGSYVYWWDGTKFVRVAVRMGNGQRASIRLGTGDRFRV